MNSHPVIKALVICFILFFSGETLPAQNQNSSSPDTSTYISYQTFFRKLKERDSVDIFYKPEWFENKKIKHSFTSLRLEDALSSVSKLCNLNYIVIDKHSFVFLPFQASSYISPGGELTDVITIGNPDEYGKYSRATIIGKVMDGNTEEPLPGAIVSIEKHDVTKRTDANGNFSLTLPAGEHIIRINHIGYEESSKKVRLAGDGEASFGLIEKSIRLKEVVITAQRAELNVTGTQMSIVSLSVKNIKELPVSLGSIDIVRSMSLLPGIQSAGEFGTGFNVRGGSSDQNLILIEDVPLFNSSHVFGLTSTITADNVKEVTLLKAGIPARYGERASSVMNIRLGTDSTNTVRAKGGIGLLDSRLSLQIPVPGTKATLLVGGRSSYSNWLLHKIPDVDLMNSSAGFYDAIGLYTINVNPVDKVILFGYYSNDRFAFSQSTNYEYSNILTSARWNHRFDRRLSSSMLVGSSNYTYSVNDLDTLHRSEGYQINLNTRYNCLKYNFSWRPDYNHSIDFGINGILYRIMPGEKLPYGSASAIKPFMLQSEKGLEMAAYISDNFDLLPGLNAEIGLRYVHYLSLGPGSVLSFVPDIPKSPETVTDTLYYSNNRVIHHYSRIEPRISFRYKLNQVSSLKGSYNRINQFINILSNNTVMSPADTWSLCSTNLRPLSSDQYAIGYFRNFENNAWEFSVETYYKTLNNVIEYKNGARVFLNDHLDTDLLSAGGYGYGVEFYARKSSGSLTGWISYTYSRSMLKTEGQYSSEQINGNSYYPSNFDKPHNLVINANYHISRRWRLSGTFAYNTGRPVTLPELKYSFQGNTLIYYSDRNKYRLPDYHRLDISISYGENLRLKRMWKGSWTFSIINIYGRDNAYSEYFAKDDSRIYRSTGNSRLYKLYIIGIPVPTLTYNFVF